MEISDAADLLALLRAAPDGRAVIHDEREGLGLYECDTLLRRRRRLADIAREGSACRLLAQAQQAEADGWIEPWLALPLRYGPLLCTWVLPDHPQAPAIPARVPGHPGS